MVHHENRDHAGEDESDRRRNRAGIPCRSRRRRDHWCSHCRAGYRSPPGRPRRPSPPKRAQTRRETRPDRRPAESGRPPPKIRRLREQKSAENTADTGQTPAQQEERPGGQPDDRSPKSRKADCADFHASRSHFRTVSPLAKSATNRRGRGYHTDAPSRTAVADHPRKGGTTRPGHPRQRRPGASARRRPARTLQRSASSGSDSFCAKLIPPSCRGIRSISRRCRRGNRGSALCRHSVQTESANDGRAEDIAGERFYRAFARLDRASCRAPGQSGRDVPGLPEERLRRRSVAENDAGQGRSRHSRRTGRACFRTTRPARRRP